MNLRERVLKLVTKKGLVRPRDVEAAGLPRDYLLRFVREGLLQKIGRGLYALPDAPIGEHVSLIEVTQRVPLAVICLVSALNFHRLTTQMPHEIWIALPKGSWRPGSGLPRLNVTFVSPESYACGVRSHKVVGGKIKVTTPAKTVADCFKFRSKVGLDVAIEALKETWRTKQATEAELADAARVCRVVRVMQPYLAAIV